MADMEKPKGIISVDVGLAAKAELKAEVPSSSMGRLVDAFTDAIRPFTEARGLRADQIRLQREDVLIQIAHKARARIEIEGGEVNPIPPRILIPLLEKASLTDASEDVLVEGWANLLISASRGASANQAIYIDILSKLDPAHLRFLQFLAQPDKENQRPDEFLDIPYDIDDFFDDIAPKIVSKIRKEESEDELIEKLREFFRRKGSCLISGFVTMRHKSGSTSAQDISGHADLASIPEFVSGALESLNLIQRHRYEYNGVVGASIWVEYHSFTLFGLEFFYAGHIGTNLLSSDE